MEQEMDVSSGGKSPGNPVETRKNKKCKKMVTYAFIVPKKG
jgi:hypothetical protein